ncbi:osteoclast-stimulating factor 1 [Trichonephila clavipes]|nr:osteoclast-stimulating factor 1 [Trichonephila clavipes]
MSHIARPAPPKPVPKPGHVKVVRALYRYVAQQADELSFEEGDNLYILDIKSDANWWKASCHGKVGLIPSNYVEERTEEVLHPLHEAAKRGNLTFLTECINNKVSVNGLDKAGCTALHWAAHAGNEECVKQLLKVSNIEINVQRLDTCQSQISEQLLDTEDAVQEYLDDMEDAENYCDRYIEMCTRVDLKIRETVVPTKTEKRSFKLPKIELKKFSGEAKDFLAFWSQFQKIHNDKGIAEEDKMQYLLQSVEPKSKAERLVLSFPAMAENYPKAIDQLKERFGCEDLLVQIYVRELLNLVMKNAVSGRTKTDLSALYDELEGKLWSLESLGRTQEKYGDFLTPLVESCLPEEILMAWERKRNTETDAKGSQTLEHLMTFLRLEIQGEEMVHLAKSGFGTPIRKRRFPN